MIMNTILSILIVTSQFQQQEVEIKTILQSIIQVIILGDYISQTAER